MPRCRTRMAPDGASPCRTQSDRSIHGDDPRAQASERLQPVLFPALPSRGRIAVSGSAKAARQRSAASIPTAARSPSSRLPTSLRHRSASPPAATAICGSPKRPPTRSAASRPPPPPPLPEFALPTPNAGPDGIILGPDGNVWFSESEVSRIGRITPDGRITEFADGITPGAKPLSISVRDGALWFRRRPPATASAA